MASACLALWMVRLNRADGQSSPVTSAEWVGHRFRVDPP